MVETTSDEKVNLVLQNIEMMVASEGGALELILLEPPALKVKYIPGVNEECPECVPTHDAVSQFLATALNVHAPYVTDVTLV